MDKFSPQEIITKMINRAFISIDLPKTNNPRTQQLLADLHIASAMVSLGTAKKKAITTELKVIHEATINSATLNEEIVVEQCSPYTLTMKVGKARASFDLDSFIKVLADEYDLSMTELTNHSRKTIKLSASPVTFTVSIDDGNE